MADEILRNAERAWVADGDDRADAYDVAHKRAGFPGLSPPRRQAVQRLPWLLRLYAIRRVLEAAKDVNPMLSSASWKEAEEAVRLLLTNPKVRELFLDMPDGAADEGARLLSLVMGIRMRRMREQTARWRRARDRLEFASMEHIVGTRSGRMTGFSSLGAELFDIPTGESPDG